MVNETPASVPSQNSVSPSSSPAPRQRVLVLGATGTIGQAAVHALLRRGHEVVCLVRQRAGPGGVLTADATRERLQGAIVRFGNPLDPASLARDGFQGERFDAVLSCLASRTGAPKDAWAVDFQAHVDLLDLAVETGVRHMVLLSAICVQRPQLAFQQAKLAFEERLVASGIDYSIVRPTAFFKSLSGQVARVQQGQPFLVFGNGTLTACKPISDRDLGDYLAACLHDPALRNRILPIGGPGQAITPRRQGEELFALLGKPARFREVPVGLLDVIVRVLGTLGRVIPGLAAKAELAKIGRYYATESMLVFDPRSGRYEADATPSTGQDTLFDYYRELIAGAAVPERGDHAVF